MRTDQTFHARRVLRERFRLCTAQRHSVPGLAPARSGSSSTALLCGPPPIAGALAARPVLGARPIPRTCRESSARRACKSAFGVLDDAAADALLERARAASMYLEGIVALPRDEADVERFEAEIRTAKRAGAQVVRTVMLSGQEVRDVSQHCRISPVRRIVDALPELAAAGVVARHGVRLAVENHKDWRADELMRVLKQAGNDHVGVCLDTGNSIALLEDPMEVVEALAPRAFTTHFKDMAVEEYKDGFLLSEVPLGDGRARPAPCDSGCASRPPGDPAESGDDHARPAQGSVPDRGLLGHVSGFARKRCRPARLSLRPRATRRAQPFASDQSNCRATSSFAAEDDNIRRCLAFARDRLVLVRPRAIDAIGRVCVPAGA